VGPSSNQHGPQGPIFNFGASLLLLDEPRRPPSRRHQRSFSKTSGPSPHYWKEVMLWNHTEMFAQFRASWPAPGLYPKGKNGVAWDQASSGRMGVVSRGRTAQAGLGSFSCQVTINTYRWSEHRERSELPT